MHTGFPFRSKINESSSLIKMVLISKQYPKRLADVAKSRDFHLSLLLMEWVTHRVLVLARRIPGPSAYVPVH